jgi:urea transport system ATP-binding protein
MLSVSNLNQYYGGSHILRDLSFEVPDGKVTALLGRNGVGKSTLLRTLMGLVPAAGGAVKFGERDLTHAKPDARARAGIGYVPQGREIFPRLSVGENLEIGLAPRSRRACSSCSPCSVTCCTGAAGISRAGSSSSSRLGARSQWGRRC